MSTSNNANSTITQYVNFIQMSKGVSESDIAIMLNDNLRHVMDLHEDRKDPDVLYALRETIKYHPNTLGVVRDFLNKYLSSEEVELEIKKAKSELDEIMEKCEPISPDSHESIKQKIDDFEKLYYERSPKSLSDAVSLGTELLQDGNLSIHERKRINDVLSKIDDAIQQKDFSDELPLDVKRIFNKHRTPAQSSMYHLALRYVEDAYELLKKYANEDSRKWEHMVPWKDAERLITELSEKVEILEYKDKADELIAKGNWQEAQNFYRMYISEFSNDLPVIEKSDRLEKFLSVVDNIKNVGQGVDIDLYPIDKLNAWFKVLQSVAPVIGSSPTYNELSASYISSVRSVVVREIGHIQIKLNKIGKLCTMRDVQRTLSEINEDQSLIEPLITGKDLEAYKTVSDENQRKRAIYDRYEKIVSQVKSGHEELLFEANRSLSLISDEFGAKDEIDQLRRELGKALITKAESSLTFGKSLFNSRRTKMYIDRARDVVSDDELKDNPSYEKVLSRLRLGQASLIILVLIICSSLLFASLWGIPKIATAIAATPTLTPSLTPTLTITPLPTSTSTPVTPTPTQMPIAQVQVSSYTNVYDKPNGKTQSAYVVRNQVVIISDCMKDENNISWVEVNWGEENSSFRGWLKLDLVDNITGSLFCK